METKALEQLWGRPKHPPLDPPIISLTKISRVAAGTASAQEFYRLLAALALIVVCSMCVG